MSFRFSLAKSLCLFVVFACACVRVCEARYVPLLHPAVEDDQAANQEPEIVLPPLSDGPSGVTVVLFGRKDVDLSAYTSLAQSLQFSLSLRSSVILRQSANQINASIVQNMQLYNLTHVIVAAHSMSPAGIVAQDFVTSQSTGEFEISGLILIAGFLQRKQRPDVVACLPKAAVQPVISFKFPLGYLKDGVHTCSGSNTVSFPVPVLTIAGELDGVVRVTRIAEAYQTQTVLSQRSSDAFAIVPGMNHANLLNVSNLPSNITSRDLSAEISNDQAISSVVEAMVAFINNLVAPDHSNTTLQTLQALTTAADDFLAPLLEAFVEQEGSWMFVGSDDEHGTSVWAGLAQQAMASPLPNTTSYQWTKAANEFHLLSDESKIPPYYRERHRPSVNVSGNVIESSTVSQLRYIVLTNAQTKFGLDGWAIIKEEKLNVLSLPDDGANFVSAIDISTKLASRQLVFNLTNTPSPDSLDNGNRCAAINALALQWAIDHSSQKSRDRYMSQGAHLVMGNDIVPSIPGGPGWIWSYLQFQPQSSGDVLVSSYAAFYSLSSNPYGAGNHYCKLLSPARAMEWIYIDSLRHASNTHAETVQLS